VSIQGPANDAHASEGPPAVPRDFTISRSGDVSAPITVLVSTTGSTATPGVQYDYAATALVNGSVVAAAATLGTDGSGSVVIPAGASATTLRITPKDAIDSGATGSSQVIALKAVGGSCCCLSGGPGYDPSPNTATMTIDDPDGGTPVVSASSPTPGQATAVEDISDGVIDIKRTSDDGSLTVPFTLSNVGGAVAGTDYTLGVVGTSTFSLDPVNGFVTLGDGTTDIYVHVTALDRAASEAPGKGVILTIKNPPSGCCCCGGGAPYALGSPYSATVTLADPPLTNCQGINVDATAGVPFSGIVARFKDSDPMGSPSDTTDQVLWNSGDATVVGTISTDPVDTTFLDVSVSNIVFAAAGSYNSSADLTNAGVITHIAFLLKVEPVQTLSYGVGGGPVSPTGPFTDIAGDLAAVTAPDPAGRTITSVDWTISGVEYKAAGQVINTSSSPFGFTNPTFDPGTVHTNTIVFNWDEKGGSNRTIKAVVHYMTGPDSPPISIQVAILQPTGNISVDQPFGAIGLYKGLATSPLPGLAMEVGNQIDPTRPLSYGITWTANMDLTSLGSFRGQFGVLQTVTTDLTERQYHTLFRTYTEETAAKSVSGAIVRPRPLLDNKPGDFLYKSAVAVDPTMVGPPPPQISHDSPGVKLNAGYDTWSDSASFSDTLMFQVAAGQGPPSLGYWIPVGIITWNYSMTVVNNDPSGTGNNYRFATVTPVSSTAYAATKIYPTWADYATDSAITPYIVTVTN